MFDDFSRDSITVSLCVLVFGLFEVKDSPQGRIVSNVLTFIEKIRFFLLALS